MFILLLGFILLTLIWTNPDATDFEKQVRTKQLALTPISTHEHVKVRSKNYLFFSYHELFISQDDQEWYHTYYSGYGILSKFVLTSHHDGEWKKSPVF